MIKVITSTTGKCFPDSRVNPIIVGSQTVLGLNVDLSELGVAVATETRSGPWHDAGKIEAINYKQGAILAA